MSLFAYSNPQTTPAPYVAIPSNNVSELIRQDYGVAISGETLLRMSVDELNKYSTYRYSESGSPPDKWYNRDTAQDVHSYQPVTGGEQYNVARGYTEMPYEQARRQARDELEIYFKAYDTSFFTIQSKWFSAADDSYLQYTKINNRIRGLMTGAAKVEPFDPPEVVFDVDEDANPFTLLNEWEAFCRKLDNLSIDARTITLGTWNAVQAATTTAEVRTIMDDHYTNNPIPAPPETP